MAKLRRTPEAVAAFNAGQAFVERSQHERALAAFTEAVRIDPEFWEAHTALGRLYAQRGDQHRYRLHDSLGQWLRHRGILEPYRARPGDRRTTPPPAFDVGQLFPELTDLRAVTVRLNPRYGEEPPVTASKLGGTLLWPTHEPWPVCAAHGIPYVGVLQLRADDFPEMPIPPGADLFQLLWCPREHDDRGTIYPDMLWAYPKFFWRDAGSITDPLPANPPPTEAYYDYVPFPCRLMPERIVEYPAVYELPDGLEYKIQEWEDQHLGADGMHICEYESDLSVCHGTKIGGYPRFIQGWYVPGCTCGRLMEHLLTIETVEWNGIEDPRWTPKEEQELFASLPGNRADWNDPFKDIRHALWSPTGLSLGDAGHMQLFVCRHCPGWPIVPAIACS
jgi:hypothetical protein